MKDHESPKQAAIFDALEMARLDPEPVPTPTGPQIDPQQLTLTPEARNASD